jgi:hypothetical protein
MKVIHVDKLISDEKMENLKNTYVKPSQIKQIFREDIDIYDNEGNILIKFRKNKLSKDKLRRYFDPLFEFTSKYPTKNRGSTSGSKSKNVYDNKPIKSSIIGYFDKWSPIHKSYFRKNNIKTPIEVRDTMFNRMNNDDLSEIEPLIEEIDHYYKLLLPEKYKKQINKAKQTKFRISNTSFTTITTNVNFRTTIHKDKGDDEEGFGNLTVIEKGTYEGGETCLPQFGIGIDVREGDILFMDVHHWHGNLPTKLLSKDASRMSIVCYLRTKVWERTRNKSNNFKKRHLKSVRKMFGKYHNNKTNKTRKHKF